MNQTCIRCALGNLKAPPDSDKGTARSITQMARAGFVNCQASPARATFLSFEAPACPRFQPLNPEQAQARIKWRESTDATTGHRSQPQSTCKTDGTEGKG